MKKASTHKRVDFNGPEPVTNKKAKTEEEEDPIEEVDDGPGTLEVNSPPQVEVFPVPCGWDEYDCVTAVEIYDREDICECFVSTGNAANRHIFRIRDFAMSYHYDNLCNMESC